MIDGPGKFWLTDCQTQEGATISSESEPLFGMARGTGTSRPV